MSLLIGSLIIFFVLIYSATSEYLLYPTYGVYSTEIHFACPDYCPARSAPVCSSNGFCIKLFDNLCHLVFFNCKYNQEYKRIHHRYCNVQRFKNLQPKVCFNDGLVKDVFNESK